MEIQIRLARPEDHEAIEDMMKQVRQLHIALRPDIYRETAAVLSLDELKAAIERDSFFVATLDGRPVGVLSVLYRHIESGFQVTRDIVFAEALAVDEKHRGKGIGGALLDHLKTLKEEKHLDGIELQVNARNGSALSFYRKYGFVPKSVNLELPE